MGVIEDEVAEFERHIGELTGELKVLRHEARGNSTEYAQQGRGGQHAR